MPVSVLSNRPEIAQFADRRQVAGKVSMDFGEISTAQERPHRAAAGRAGPKVIIIGSGVGGILMGIKLLQRGWRDFVILEKARTLGGTWRDNVYPGVACDVPAHVYVYSFAPNPWWKTRYAKGASIWKYYHDVAKRFGVLPHIRYGKEVDRARFDGARWTVTTKDGESLEADIVIGATGRLHHPKTPDIPGAERFAGPRFHTARWDRSVSLKGKRVGLIGAGSSAVQMLSNVVGEVGRITLFQRTPQWVFPVEDTPIPLWKRLAFRLVPGLAQRNYETMLRESNERGKLAFEDPSARAARDAMCTDALARIRDPELRAKLTPNYAVGCKRLVMSNKWYEAVQQPNVEVVTTGIDHIEPKGVVTADGRLREFDILVFATGFDAHAYIRPIQLQGEGGVTLNDVWSDLPLTYRSVAIPHMPNFFMVNGPSSPGGSASIVGIIETQAAYLFQLFEHIVAKGVTVAPRAEVAEAWLATVRERARGSVWATGGCQSWYLDHTGTPAYDAISLPELQKSLERPILDDFVVRPIGETAQGRTLEDA
jgi:cation diffusion facilitator CzcD-associated flavoprotein CzcO